MYGFEKYDPFRAPNWRQRRAIQLLGTLPLPKRPDRNDDKFIVGYYRFLAAVATAGNEDELESRHEEWPEIREAHRRYYSPDVESRQILEALLLTTETFEAIAARFDVEPYVIVWYEKLFFNIRDRMEATTWIFKTILGSPDDRRASPDGVMTERQRGYLYRLFAFYGGPIVLDALVTGIGDVAKPASPQAVPEWQDATLTSILRIRAAATAVTMEVNRKNAMRLVKLALRQNAQNRKHPLNPEAQQRQYAQLAKALASMTGGSNAASVQHQGATTESKRVPD